MCNCALGIRHVAHAYDTGTTSNLPCQCFPVVNNTQHCDKFSFKPKKERHEEGTSFSTHGTL